MYQILTLPINSCIYESTSTTYERCSQAARGEAHRAHDDRDDQRSQLQPQEGEKERAVAAPDGIADPGAEVVKLLDAAVGGRAVLGAQRPHDAARHAQLRAPHSQ